MKLTTPEERVERIMVTSGPYSDTTVIEIRAALKELVEEATRKYYEESFDDIGDMVGYIISLVNEVLTQDERIK